MSNARTSGREPITYVEIDQDFCGQTYGIAPCNAQVGVTGDARCYNTLATCQWRSAWVRTVKTLRFTDQQDAPERDAIPSVVSIETAPTVINPGGAGSRSGPLGQRASVAITFQDHPDTDALTDPYYASRALGIARDWRERGTFWTRWLARNPYHVNRIVRIRTGYRGQELHEFTMLTYLIERIDGPDPSGRVTLRAKDVLRLADDDKAVAPKVSPGMLIADVPDNTLPAFLRVTGASAADYPAPRWVRIGREIFAYSSVTTISSSEIRLNLTARGQYNTEQKAHRAGDRVQWCYVVQDANLATLVYQLLTTFAGVPTEYIDLPAWQAERNAWLAAFNVWAVISEPTGVRQLISELAEQCQFSLWWDERARRIRFEALKPLDGLALAQLNDDEHIVADSVRMRAEPNSRASQVWVFYDVTDPTERVDTDTNYRRILVRADLDAESPDEYGEAVIYKVHSRWLTSEAQALNAASRILERRRDPQRTVTLDADAKDGEIWTGDVIDVLHRGIVDFEGRPALTRFQVTSAEEVEIGHRIRYELQSYAFAIGVRSAFWMAANAPAYADASPTEKARGAWWAEADGTVGGDPGYNWV